MDSDWAEKCGAAYRYYRTLQHAQRLHDAVQVCVDDTLLSHYENVKMIWKQVFDEDVKTN